MEIKLYSTGCPKCNVLKMKLKAKHLDYKEISDINTLQEMGLQSVPYLQIDNTELMDFNAANTWINQQ